MKGKDYGLIVDYRGLIEKVGYRYGSVQRCRAGEL